MNDRFKDYFEVISGYAFKSSDLLDEGDIPIIKIGNISNGEDVIEDSNSQYVSSDFASLDEKYHVNQGDVLISLTGSHINQPNSMVGRSCRNYSNKEFLLNQRAGKVIPKDGVSLDYIYYLLSSKSIKESIVIRAYGAANQVNISPTTIGKMKWVFPDKTVQQKIGDILSNYDKHIYINKRRIAALESVAEELYKEWFVRFRFPGYENVEFEEENPKGWIFGEKEHTYKPKEWHYTELQELAKFVRGKNITADEMCDGNIPVISAGLLPSGMHNKANVYGNNLTISASGANAGFLSYHLESIWAADCSYYNNEQNIWFIYASLKFLQPVISNLQAGAAQPHVYPKHVNKISVLNPGEKWIGRYCEEVVPIYNQIKLLLKQNRNLIEQRDLLLPRLINGKIELK